MNYVTHYEGLADGERKYLCLGQNFLSALRGGEKGYRRLAQEDLSIKHRKPSYLFYLKKEAPAPQEKQVLDELQ